MHLFDAQTVLQPEPAPMQLSPQAINVTAEQLAIADCRRCNHDGSGKKPGMRPVLILEADVRALFFAVVAAGMLVGQGAALAAQDATPSASPANCPVTTEAENQEIASVWHEEAINNGNLDALRDVVAPDVVHHAAGGYPDVSDVEGVVIMMGAFPAAFSDLHYTVDFWVTQDDMVVERYTATGTQDGPLGDMPATGRSATWTGVNIFRIECGQIAEVWSEVDALSRNAQLFPEGQAMATPAMG